MGKERKIEEAPEDLHAIASRRHRPASEIRFANRSLPLPVSFVATGTLTDDLRAALWDVVLASLFAGTVEVDAWRPDRASVTERPAVRRVWSAPPIGGEPDRIPEDIVDVLEGWFSLVEPADVYAFLETVHDSLETAAQPRFVSAVNGALERGFSDHRFVLRKLMPIASRADIAAIDRSLAACRSAHWSDVEERLLDALGGLASKPEPDPRGAIQEAIRAVQLAAVALTGEQHFDLEDALQDLEQRGHVDKALKTAYAGLFVYVTNVTRKTTTDDARLIVVMCAGFVSHLANRTK